MEVRRGLFVVLIGDGGLDAVAAKPEVDEVVDSLLTFRHTTLEQPGVRLSY